MKILIQGLEYKNIREFDKLKLDFINPSSEKPFHVSLIQMPNGTGKTTSMELIRYALLGKKLDKNIVKSFRPAGKKHIKNGCFILKLDIDGEKFHVKTIFNYESGDVSYETVITKETGGGSIIGHHLPLSVKSMLSENFIKLFVFDGELAHELIKDDNTRAEDSIKTVYLLDKIELIKTKIKKVVDAEEQKAIAELAKNATFSLKALKQREANLKKDREKLEKINSEIIKIEQNISQLEKQLHAIKDRTNNLERELTTDQNETDKINEEIAIIEERRRANFEQLMQEFIRSPIYFSPIIRKSLENLVNQMNVLRLPKSTSAEFFIELSESEYCVCGEKIDEEKKKIILERAEKYLSDEYVGSLNAMKYDIRIKLEKIERDKIEQHIENIGRLADKLNELKNKKDILITSNQKQQEKLIEYKKLTERQTKIRQLIEKSEKELQKKEKKLPSLA